MKSKKIFIFLLPFIIVIIGLGYYNFERFDSFLASGYQSQLIPDALVVENRDTQGLFSFEHLQRNLFFFFLGIPHIYPFSETFAHVTKLFPVFDPRGMSIFITSPWLLIGFFLKYKARIHAYLCTTAIIGAGAILLWHSTGCAQFGYRLALDFLPFVILSIMIAYRDTYKTLQTKFKILLLFGFAINIILVIVGIFTFAAVPMSICST